MVSHRRRGEPHVGWFAITVVFVILSIVMSCPSSSSSGRRFFFCDANVIYYNTNTTVTSGTMRTVRIELDGNVDAPLHISISNVTVLSELRITVNNRTLSEEIPYPRVITLRNIQTKKFRIDGRMFANRSLVNGEGDQLTIENVLITGGDVLGGFFWDESIFENAENAIFTLKHFILHQEVLPLFDGKLPNGQAFRLASKCKNCTFNFFNISLNISDSYLNSSAPQANWFPEMLSEAENTTFRLTWCMVHRFVQQPFFSNVARNTKNCSLIVNYLHQKDERSDSGRHQLFSHFAEGSQRLYAIMENIENAGGGKGMFYQMFQAINDSSEVIIQKLNHGSLTQTKDLNGFADLFANVANGSTVRLEDVTVFGEEGFQGVAEGATRAEVYLDKIKTTNNAQTNFKYLGRNSVNSSYQLTRIEAVGHFDFYDMWAGSQECYSLVVANSSVSNGNYSFMYLGQECKNCVVTFSGMTVSGYYTFFGAFKEAKGEFLEFFLLDSEIDGQFCFQYLGTMSSLTVKNDYTLMSLQIKGENLFQYALNDTDGFDVITNFRVAESTIGGFGHFNNVSSYAKKSIVDFRHIICDNCRDSLQSMGTMSKDVVIRLRKMEINVGAANSRNLGNLNYIFHSGLRGYLRIENSQINASDSLIGVLQNATDSNLTIFRTQLGEEGGSTERDCSCILKYAGTASTRSTISLLTNIQEFGEKNLQNICSGNGTRNCKVEMSNVNSYGNYFALSAMSDSVNSSSNSFNVEDSNFVGSYAFTQGFQNVGTVSVAFTRIYVYGSYFAWLAGAPIVFQPSEGRLDIIVKDSYINGSDSFNYVFRATLADSQSTVMQPALAAFGKSLTIQNCTFDIGSTLSLQRFGKRNFNVQLIFPEVGSPDERTIIRGSRVGYYACQGATGCNIIGQSIVIEGSAASWMEGALLQSVDSNLKFSLWESKNGSSYLLNYAGYESRSATIHVHDFTDAESDNTPLGSDRHFYRLGEKAENLTVSVKNITLSSTRVFEKAMDGTTQSSFTIFSNVDYIGSCNGRSTHPCNVFQKLGVNAKELSVIVDPSIPQLNASAFYRALWKSHNSTFTISLLKKNYNGSLNFLGLEAENCTVRLSNIQDFQDGENILSKAIRSSLWIEGISSSKSYTLNASLGESENCVAVVLSSSVSTLGLNYLAEYSKGLNFTWSGGSLPHVYVLNHAFSFADEAFVHFSNNFFLSIASKAKIGTSITNSVFFFEDPGQLTGKFGISANNLTLLCERCEIVSHFFLLGEGIRNSRVTLRHCYSQSNAFAMGNWLLNAVNTTLDILSSSNMALFGGLGYNSENCTVRIEDVDRLFQTSSSQLYANFKDSVHGTLLIKNVVIGGGNKSKTLPLLGKNATDFTVVLQNISGEIASFCEDCLVGSRNAQVLFDNVHLSTPANFRASSISAVEQNTSRAFYVTDEFWLQQKQTFNLTIVDSSFHFFGSIFERFGYCNRMTPPNGDGQELLGMSLTLVNVTLNSTLSSVLSEVFAHGVSCPSKLTVVKSLLAGPVIMSNVLINAQNTSEPTVTLNETTFSTEYNPLTAFTAAVEVPVLQNLGKYFLGEFSSSSYSSLQGEGKRMNVIISSPVFRQTTSVNGYDFSLVFGESIGENATNLHFTMFNSMSSSTDVSTFFAKAFLLSSYCDVNIHSFFAPQVKLEVGDNFGAISSHLKVSIDGIHKVGGFRYACHNSQQALVSITNVATSPTKSGVLLQNGFQAAVEADVRILNVILAWGTNLLHHAAQSCEKTTFTVSNIVSGAPATGLQPTMASSFAANSNSVSLFFSDSEGVYESGFQQAFRGSYYAHISVRNISKLGSKAFEFLALSSSYVWCDISEIHYISGPMAFRGVGNSVSHSYFCIRRESMTYITDPNAFMLLLLHAVNTTIDCMTDSVTLSRSHSKPTLSKTASGGSKTASRSISASTTHSAILTPSLGKTLTTSEQPTFSPTLPCAGAGPLLPDQATIPLSTLLKSPINITFLVPIGLQEEHISINMTWALLLNYYTIIKPSIGSGGNMTDTSKIIIELQAPGDATIHQDHPVTIFFSKEMFLCAPTNGLAVHILIERYPTPIPVEVKEAIRAVSVTTGAIAGILSNPTIAMQSSRLNALFSLSVCEFSHSEPLGSAVSLTGFGFGVPVGRYYRGAIVGNSAVLVGVALLIVLIAIVLHKFRRNKKNTFWKTLGYVHFPGFCVVPFVVISQGTVTAAIALMLWGGDRSDMLMGGIGLFFMCAIVFFCLVVTTREFDAIAVDREKITNKSQEQSSSHVFRKISGLFYNPWKWMDTGNGFKVHYQHIFYDYKEGVQWFLCVEMVITMLIGVCDGIRPSHENYCSIILGFMLLLNFILVILLIIYRPFMTKFNAYHSLLVNIAALISAACLAYSIATGSEKALAASESFSTIALGIAVLKVLTDALFFFIWLHERSSGLVKRFRMTFQSSYKSQITAEDVNDMMVLNEANPSSPTATQDVDDLEQFLFEMEEQEDQNKNDDKVGDGDNLLGFPAVDDEEDVDDENVNASLLSAADREKRRRRMESARKRYESLRDGLEGKKRDFSDWQNDQDDQDDDDENDNPLYSRATSPPKRTASSGNMNALLGAARSNVDLAANAESLL